MRKNYQSHSLERLKNEFFAYKANICFIIFKIRTTFATSIFHSKEYT